MKHKITFENASIELARQAIDILGEHVIKTALGVFE